MNRTLLAVAIATATTTQLVYAAPFMPMDARGLAMGNTGVASAKRAHAPAYNPSLLSQARDHDDFSLIFPQIGVMAGDPAEISDTATDIADEIFPKFEDLVSESGGLEDRVDALKDAIEDLETSLNGISINSSSSTNDIQTALTTLRTSNTDLNTKSGAVRASFVDINNVNKELTDALRGISGNPLNARLGVSTALAVPSKKFAVAVGVSGSANISAKVNFENKDFDLLNAYVPAADGYVASAQSLTAELDSALNAMQSALDSNDTNTINSAVTTLNSEINNLKTSATALKSYSSESVDAIGGPIIVNGALSTDAKDPDLASTAQVVAVAVVDVGVSFSREFDIQGKKIAIGITPKIQKISTFHYADEIDGFDDVESDDLKDSQLDYTKVNLDIGASYRFGDEGNWMVGVVAKNLLGGTFDYKDITVTPSKKDNNDNVIPTGASSYQLRGGSVSLKPQYRAGVSYNSSWFNAALDVDLIENKPVAFEAPTQYAALGVELDAWGWAQLRAGYRTNMAEGGVDVASVGLGLSPGDVFNIDITAMANPSDYLKEAGVILEMGLNF